MKYSGQKKKQYSLYNTHGKVKENMKNILELQS
jgi:hypothetical protein